MSTLPHDLTDLYLAPVLLAVQARIEELGALPLPDLAIRIGLDSDLADWTPTMRDDALLRTVGHLLDLHDWQLSWDRYGLKVSHDTHSVVLGVPKTFADFRVGLARRFGTAV
jgi:hypothetical protein